jgi:flagellar FliL protein
MAAGKKDEKPNKQDNDEPPVDAVVDEAKQKKKKLFMFIGLAVLLVAISVGATFFIVSKMLGGKSSSADEEASSSESSEPAEVVVKPAIYFPLKVFTVNFDVNGRQRFLQAELTLMYRDEVVLKTLELHMPAVRNRLVMLLSRQVFDELQTSEGKERLRAAALTEIQDIIAKETAASAEKTEDKEDKEDKPKEKPPEPNIEQVLFTQFVMQ